MSAICSSCAETCYGPERIWYAATRFDWNVWWACSKCVDRIPVEERHPTSVLMEFEVTFGPLKAETNDRGVYQGSTSRQLTPQFWVRNDSLARYVPGGQDFVDRFSPFNEVGEYLEWYMDGVRAGRLPQTGGHEKLLRDLTLLGPLLERYLLGPGKPKRKVVIPYDLEALSTEQEQLAEELLELALARYASKQ